MWSRLNPYHPLGFLRNREMNNVIPSWTGIVDARAEHVSNFYRKNLYAHYGCVNAIEFSNDGSMLLSAGDDRRVLLWNFHQAIHGNCTPVTLQAEHTSNVFTVAFNGNNTRVFSGGNDDQVIIHDTVTGKPLDYFRHEQPVYGISVDPMNDYIFASACDDGRLLIYDIREPATSDPFCLATTTAAFHAVMFNPAEPRLVVSANSKKGVALWDVRMPEKSVMNYGGNNSDQCCMSARFSQDGSKILALRRRLPPILYSTCSTNHLFQFNHLGYYNSCTMKSCSFAGSNDQFVVSGSDNFDLYMWKIPTDAPSPTSPKRFVKQAQLVLHGHRSIVNQVRYNPKYSVIASSGVEKMVKLWSPFPLPNSNDGRSSLELAADKERPIYSHGDYINLVMQSGQTPAFLQFLSLTFDTSRRNTREDPRMMAFFDALVQRDIDGMTDDDELPSPKVSYTNTNIQSTSSSDAEDQNEASAAVESSEDEDAVNNSNEEVEPIESHDDQGTAAGTEPESNDISDEDSSGGSEHEQPPRRKYKNCTPNPSSSEQSSSSPTTAPRQDNLITKLIAGKQEQLLRMAKANAELELNGKEKVKKRRQSIFQRLRKLNKKTCSLTMNLLPLPGDEEDPTDSSDSGRARAASEVTSSSSDSSSSSSSEDDEDLDKKFKTLKKNINPMLSKKVYEHSDSNEESLEESDDKPALPPPRNGRRRMELQVTHKKKELVAKNMRQKKRTDPKPPKSSVDSVEDQQPCTSASVLKRDALLAKKQEKQKKSKRKKRKKSKSKRKPESSSSSSSSSSESGNTTDSLQSRKSDFIARLQEVSRRLKRVSQELVNSTSAAPLLRRIRKRKQQSTMINSPSSSSDSDTNSSSSSSSSASSSGTSSDSSDQLLVDKLPPPKKRRKVQDSDTNNRNHAVNSETETASHPESNQIPNCTSASASKNTDQAQLEPQNSREEDESEPQQSSRAFVKIKTSTKPRAYRRPQENSDSE